MDNLNFNYKKFVEYLGKDWLKHAKWSSSYGQGIGT
jgi:hypothetical protein